MDEIDQCDGTKKRNFCFTWNNYPNDASAILQTKGFRYLCFGYEIAPTTGTPHLQGYFVCPSPIKLSSARSKLPGADVRVARGDSLHNYEYCSKTRVEDDHPNERFEEYGERPLTQREKGNKEVERWDTIKSLAKAGRVEEIESSVYVKHYNTLKRIASDNQTPPNKLNGYVGWWIWGVSGVGKSYTVHERYGTTNIYLKPLTKWWNAYRGQDVVLVDDMSPFKRELGDDLKQWGHEYPVLVEVKGDYRMIRPRVVIVTSQYPIEKVFTDHETCMAIKNRYIEVEKTSREQDMSEYLHDRNQIDIL